MTDLLTLDFLVKPGTLERYTESIPTTEKLVWTLVSLPGIRAIDTRQECLSGYWELRNPTRESFMLVHDAVVYSAAWGLLTKGTVTIYPERCMHRRKVIDAVGLKCYTDYPLGFVKSHIQPASLGPYANIGSYFEELLNVL